jgi:hypothetical protein
MFEISRRKEIKEVKYVKKYSIPEAMLRAPGKNFRPAWLNNEENQISTSDVCPWEESVRIAAIEAAK